MLNKILEEIAPSFMAGRAAARLRLENAKHQRALFEQTRKQSYRAAQRGGRFSNWARPHTSANSEIQMSLPMLRASARDLVRNNPFANRITRVLPSHIAGTGVRPRPQFLDPGNDASKILSKKMVHQWERFVENCDPARKLDFYGFQRLVTRAVIEGGEALILWVPQEINGALRWRLQILEGDCLDHNKNETFSDGRRIIQGVEIDKWGTRIAYWLFLDHPGERFAQLRGIESRRISAEYVDHCLEIMRPGQIRGVPWLSPVATILRDLDDFGEAELVRKKLEACISMVVTNNNEDGGIEGIPILAGGEDEGKGSQAMLTDAGGKPIERMSPGMVLEARPGWGVEFNAPPASAGLAEHMRERLHAVAAGAGTTYMQLTGDVSQANFSSMREGRLEFERLVDGWQDDLMIMQMGRPAWERVIRAGQINGTLPNVASISTEWVRPKRPWVDPLKDVKAAIEEIKAGLSSPQEVIARRGRYPDVVRAENDEWAKGNKKGGKENANTR